MFTDKIKLPVKKCHNWDNFTNSPHIQLLGEFDPDLWTPATVEMEVEALEDCINKALNESTYFKSASFQAAAWWTAELQLERSKVLALHRTWRRSPQCVSAKIDYLAAKTNFKYVCYKAKKKSWRNHCDQITTPKQFAALNRCLKNKTSADIGLLLNSWGEYSRSPQETIRILTETHLPGCRPHKPPKHAPSINARWCNENGSIRSCSRNDLVNSFITETAVPTAIKSFGSQKAPGPDGLIPMALQCFIKNNNTLKRLCWVYQTMLELQYTPEHWCSSKLIFIPKPNKDYRLAKSFRPISLMPFLFKTCEKLANWEIEQKILINRPFSINQHAFRKNFSTDTAVSNLIDGIESYILGGK